MLSKKVSLIVATRNRASDLEKLLNSFVITGLITDKNLEVVIIDNAPDDNSTEILCKKYKVRYCRENQRGESFALNLGMKIATGEYVVNTDDDVIIKDKAWLQKLLNNFMTNTNIGYVSGNVLALNTENDVAITWEKKGGLSKGKHSKLYTHEELITKYRFVPWPINKIAAGANNMVPMKVFRQVGPYATFLGGGSPIGHANSLEFVYRVIRAGYDVKFDSSPVVYHLHPSDKLTLKKKLFTYGVGNSAYQLYLFAKFGDLRCMYWGLLGHHLYVIRNLLTSVLGMYPLSATYVIYSLIGSISGTIQFLYKYPFRDKNLYP